MSAYDEAFTEVAPNVHIGRGEIVITGVPSWTLMDAPDDHNCDTMGCGQTHVLYRAFLASPNIHPSRSGAESTEGIIRLAWPEHCYCSICDESGAMAVALQNPRVIGPLRFAVCREHGVQLGDALGAACRSSDSPHASRGQ